MLSKEFLEKFKKCPTCEGVGRVPWGDTCNCGSGEGCSIHDAWFWGKICPDCNGKIWIKNENKSIKKRKLR